VRRLRPSSTVNPDIFTNVVVPEYRLDRRVDLIVTSWQQGTEDRVALCGCVVARLGIAAPLNKCLLDDNRADRVLAWRSNGGAACHFRGEDAFCEEFAAIASGLGTVCRTVTTWDG
jgi:hypothetical protein